MSFVKFKKAPPKQLRIADNRTTSQGFTKGFMVGLWLGAMISTLVWLM